MFRDGDDLLIRAALRFSTPYFSVLAGCSINRPATCSGCA
jgi:hypothetical protein